MNLLLCRLRLYAWLYKQKTKGDEDKIGSGLARLREEDPSFQVVVDGENKADNHFRPGRASS